MINKDGSLTVYQQQNGETVENYIDRVNLMTSDESKRCRILLAELLRNQKRVNGTLVDETSIYIAFRAINDFIDYIVPEYLPINPSIVKGGFKIRNWLRGQVNLLEAISEDYYKRDKIQKGGVK